MTIGARLLSIIEHNPLRRGLGWVLKKSSDNKIKAFEVPGSEELANHTFLSGILLLDADNCSSVPEVLMPDKSMGEDVTTVLTKEVLEEENLELI